MAKTSRRCGSAFRHGLGTSERGGARLERENKADDDGAFYNYAIGLMRQACC
jgi:hypothetical protein